MYSTRSPYNNNNDNLRAYSFDDSECCNCGENETFTKPDTWLSVGAGIGAITMLVSVFLPSWRYDSHGTTELEEYWELPSSSGLSSRSYGLIHITGTWTQTWLGLSQAACDVKNIGHITNLAGTTFSFVTGQCGNSTSTSTCCSASSLCQTEFAKSMHVRCTEYKTLMQISTMTVVGTVLACGLIALGCTIFGLSKRKRTGGITFGLWLFAGILAAVVNAVWALVSDGIFKELAKSSWYPYPSLSLSFYLHITGYSVVLICATVFAFLVLPEVCDYDAAQEKLERKQDRANKYMEKRNQIVNFMAGQQRPACRPYGNYGPQPNPYGQPSPHASPRPYGAPPGNNAPRGPRMAPMPQGFPPVGAPAPVPVGFGGPPVQVGPPAGQTGFGIGPAVMQGGAPARQAEFGVGPGISPAGHGGFGLGTAVNQNSPSAGQGDFGIGPAAGAPPGGHVWKKVEFPPDAFPNRSAMPPGGAVPAPRGPPPAAPTWNKMPDPSREYIMNKVLEPSVANTNAASFPMGGPAPPPGGFANLSAAPPAGKQTWNQMPQPSGGISTAASIQHGSPSPPGGFSNLSASPPTGFPIPAPSAPPPSGGFPNLAASPPVGSPSADGYPNLSAAPPQNAVIAVSVAQRPPVAGGADGLYNWPAYQATGSETWNKMPEAPPAYEQH